MTEGQNIVAIIQARMASTRLPGKVLADISGQPMLAHVVERVSSASTLSRVVVATTTDAIDDPVAQLCAERGYSCFRGHPTDVLDRYVQAAREFDAEIIVRITADCPLIDPALIDRTISAFLKADPPADFAANRFPGRRIYPIGEDVEVCSIEALEKAWREADQPDQREHVMPYLYQVEGRFRVVYLESERDLGDLRWTVDTAEDLAFVREIFKRFDSRTDFNLDDILALIKREPELAEINAQVQQKPF